VLAVGGCYLASAATQAVMGADRLPDRGHDLGLGVLAAGRQVTGEQRLR
jgi:hypothetical protein